MQCNAQKQQKEIDGPVHLLQEAPSQSPAARAAPRRNKKGNPLEFLQLLTSLVKRW